MGLATGKLQGYVHEALSAFACLYRDGFFVSIRDCRSSSPPVSSPKDAAELSCYAQIPSLELGKIRASLELELGF